MSVSAVQKTNSGVSCKMLFTAYHMLQKFIENLFEYTDASSLAFFRISYGLLMTIDVIEERSFSDLEEKYSDTIFCHFPLINSLPVLPYEWMCLLYLFMWLGAIGIMLGYRYHFCCTIFIISFWYLILLHKEKWNNHTYMFGLLAILLFTTNANVCWSVDTPRLLKSSEKQLEEPPSVPNWNYFILRFQVFILYFMAGVKKINSDWLSGYSVTDLGYHWVFDPFKIFLTVDQIDLWVIHRFGFILDLVSGFGLCFEKTRPVTFFFLFFFHAMNSRMFRIGMFPYAGIATMFVFCETTWPRKLLRKICFKISFLRHLVETFSRTYIAKPGRKSNVTWFYKVKVLSLILLHMSVQVFLPFSHFITKGYNRWTRGQYGYSWDMMVNVWDTYTLSLIIKDDSSAKYYLEADVWTGGDIRWARHADMVKQFSTCAKQRFEESKTLHGRNVSLHIDMWMSLNGRIHQRVYDPTVNLLTAEWSPWEDVTWIMPLLDEFSDLRPFIRKLQDDLQRPSEGKEAAFFIDFPGYTKETFISDSVFNVELTVLNGSVEVLELNKTVVKGKTISLGDRSYLQILTTSKEPSCYYITYKFEHDQDDDDGGGKEKDNQDDYKKRQNQMNLVVRYLVDVYRALRSVSRGLNVIIKKHIWI